MKTTVMRALTCIILAGGCAGLVCVVATIVDMVLPMGVALALWAAYALFCWRVLPASPAMPAPGEIVFEEVEDA